MRRGLLKAGKLGGSGFRAPLCGPGMTMRFGSFEGTLSDPRQQIPAPRVLT
ncbi:MAG: hypothetical protein K0Q54_4955 [Methylobacterium brachiatum]|jgi:hypothetical protein|nr:hypothetical protein [Methylobacterium brachiatum]